LATKDGEIESGFAAVAKRGGPPDPPDMLEPRVARLEADVAELKADVKAIRIKIENLPTRTEMAALPTRNDLRTWSLAVIAITVASVIAVGFGVGSLVQAGMANQLSAFQAGLSAIQAAGQREPAPPIIINVPAPSAPTPPPPPR
jgi:hypothetical protein